MVGNKAFGNMFGRRGWKVVQRNLQGSGLKMRRPPCGGAGNDTVEIGRDHLDLLEALVAARAAGRVIGVGYGRVVVGLDDGFGEDDRAMHRSASPICCASGMVQDPRAIKDVGDVAGVGSHTCEAILREAAPASLVYKSA